MKIVLATRNAGKINEMSALLSDLGVEILSIDEIKEMPPVREDGATLEDNALKKARAVARHTGLPALADDTGLEVDALEGRPGVHSARYGGADENDDDNRRQLLLDLANTSNRTARFRTVLAFVDQDEVQFFEGLCQGVITWDERGEEGFGYDSIFIPAGEETTFAQMSAARKNAISHRRRALDAFARFMRERLED